MAAKQKLHHSAVKKFLELAEISFKEQTLLQRALTHSSYAYEQGGECQDNEKLEFLGDAVLDLIVVEHFFQLAGHGQLAVGEIAKMKAWVVSEQVLAKCAVNLQLAPCLLLGNGEQQSGGRQRSGTLADAMEAVIGAYYLDSSIDQVRLFVSRILLPYLDQARDNRHCSDYKSYLQRYVQANFGELPQYRLVEISGPEHRQNFAMEVSFEQQRQGWGCGASKKEASKAAALDACRKLGLIREQD